MSKYALIRSVTAGMQNKLMRMSFELAGFMAVTMKIAPAKMIDIDRFS